MTERTYFRENANKCSLTRAGDLPIREAQLGALHAIGAHFSLHSAPAIVALPTGVGKSAVGAAAPFVIPKSNRVLYVVPTKVLRQDAVANLSEQRHLRAVSFLDDDVPNPDVLEVDSRPADWDVFEAYDAAVALPNSLFELIEDQPPPRDLFDVVVFDEAHHVPARTWQVISAAFDARMVLLTATPYRRDAQELPGEIVYNYPLSRAIADGAYVPIDLVGVETLGLDEAARDLAIAERAVEVLRGPDHVGKSSRLLVRASTKVRAETLVGVYENLGVTVRLVHSGLTPRTVEQRIAEVRAGDVEGIAFVGVLGEGFDCPELKVGAYHDKHKSLPVTLQFLGRLSRVCSSAGPPQVVAAVETLRGDTWALWRRDSDWSRIVPEFAEGASEDVVRRKELLGAMDDFPRGEVSLNDISIRPSFGLYQVPNTVNAGGDPITFGLSASNVAEAGLETGGEFAGGPIIWSHLNSNEQFLMFVTAHRERPDWLRSDALDTERFEMHVLLVRLGPDGVPVVAVCSASRKREAELMADLTGAPERFQLASPDLMRRFLNVAQIGNILHLGTRNTEAGAQARTYTTNSGRAVEDGLTFEDLRDDVIGHVGALCHIDGKDYNGGVSITNSRLWIIKSFQIDGYIDFVSNVLDQMGAGQPGEIRRLSARFETTLTDWPEADVVAVALDPYFLTDVSDVGGIHPADLDISAGEPVDHLLPISILDLGWSASLRVNGTISGESHDINVVTAAGSRSLLDLLLEYPPTFYFRNGTQTRGSKAVPPGSGYVRAPWEEILDKTWDWSATNIEHEIPRAGSTDSIHEKVVAELSNSTPGSWLLGDDGSGEIADHIFIQPPQGDEQLHLHLFHSKASGSATAGLRTGDFDELVGQMVRSKRWVAMADQGFWERLATRLTTRASAQVIAGGTEQQFRDACRGWSDTPPLVTVHYVAVQPGLDVDALLAHVAVEDAQGARLAETIASCASWVGSANCRVRIIGS